MLKRSHTTNNHATRVRLKQELSISRHILAEDVEVAPRFIIELPDLERMIILTNLPAYGLHRAKALRLIAGILAYKTVLSFVFALETFGPDALNAVLVSPGMQLGALQNFGRSNLEFGEAVFFDPRHTDRDIVELFPKGCIEITRKDEVAIQSFLDEHEVRPDIYLLEI